MLARFELMSPIELKNETEALCLEIETLSRRQKGNPMPFDEVERMWKSTLQPRAHLLAEEMTSYVPHNDPRINVVLREGEHRIVRSSDLIVIDSLLPPSYTVMHLEQVVSCLRRLAAYLPLRIQA